MTADRLVTEDIDSQRDVYDARVGGGFPVLPPASSPPCEGDACQGAPTPPPVFGAPASATFSGTGNLAPPAPVKPKPLTRAQLLAKALKACHAKKSKHKRKACERQARKRYGAKAAAKKGAGRRK